MPRLRDRRWRYEPTVSATIDLMMGPTEGDGELTVAQLEVAWQVEGEELMRGYRARPGTRPWGYWAFELGEDKPVDEWKVREFGVEDRHREALRLAELGLLTVEERAVFHERASEAKIRIGTDRERLSGEHSVDVDAVELWEAIEARP